MIYHYKVTITMGCGCEFDQYIQMADGVEPCGEHAYSALLSAIMHPRFAEEMCIHEHLEKGEEKVDVSVRTKVGPVPEEDTL